MPFVLKPVSSSQIENLRFEIRLDTDHISLPFITEIKIIVVKNKAVFLPVESVKAHCKDTLKAVINILEFDVCLGRLSPNARLAIYVDRPQIEWVKTNTMPNQKP